MKQILKINLFWGCYTSGVAKSSLGVFLGIVSCGPFASVVAKVAPKQSVEGPIAYANDGVVDLPTSEMINRHSKFELARTTKHKLKSS